MHYINNEVRDELQYLSLDLKHKCGSCLNEKEEQDEIGSERPIENANLQH